MPKRFLILLFLLFPALPMTAHAVLRDGKQWLQPFDFANLSWVMVTAVCPPPNFRCAGTLAGKDMTGFTFASVADVTALLAGYGIIVVPGSTRITEAQWTAFTKDFIPRPDGGGDTNIQAILSGPLSADNGFVPTLLVVRVDKYKYWEVNLMNYVNPPGFASYIGAWFYRDMRETDRKSGEPPTRKHP